MSLKGLIVGVTDDPAFPGDVQSPGLHMNLSIKSQLHEYQRTVQSTVGRFEHLESEIL
jgi:hypothetical protein